MSAAYVDSSCLVAVLLGEPAGVPVGELPDAAPGEMIRSVVASQNSSAPNGNRWKLGAEIRAKRGWTEPPVVSR